MKAVFRVFALWLILGGLACLLARAAHEEVIQPLAVGALFVLPVLAVWITINSVAALPRRWPARIGFWIGTVAGWSALLVLMQGRAESHDAERSLILSALGLAGFVALWLAIRTQSFPSPRVIGEVTAAVALLALAGGVFAWSFDARTRSIATQAEARWIAIGMPMPEFEKALAPSYENTGSEVLRQVFREQLNSRFYKDGTRAAEREPAIQPSPASAQLIKEAVDLLKAKLPPSDDLDLPSQSVAGLELLAAALDADYHRILEAGPASWASDPHDGFSINVPNFLGSRHFAQVIAADSVRRLSLGDQDGAGRALAAGLCLRDGLRENPTLVSLMIAVAVDALLSSKQVRLPSSEDGLPSIAREGPILRAHFLWRLQMEAWVGLKMARAFEHRGETAGGSDGLLPGWVARIANRRWYRRQFATGALNGAEHAAIQKSPATLALPDLGASLHTAVSEANPTIFEVNNVRAILRIHATLLLREQMELIRDARARLAAGRPVESRDSVVLPGLRWELMADAEKATVATRLAGAPEWIVKNQVTDDDFWLLPLDGSVAWRLHLPALTTNRN